MPGRPAARILDPVLHVVPGMLMPGPGSFNTFIGGRLAWRGVPLGAVAGMQAAKAASEARIAVAQAATLAAAGTPGLPAAKAAEEALKLAESGAMSASIAGMAGGADLHACISAIPIPLPPPHGIGVVIDGSPTVLINGLPACRLGDTILEAFGPPNKIIMGEIFVLIGNAAGVIMIHPVLGTVTQVELPDGSVVTQVGDRITIEGTPEFQAAVLADLVIIGNTPTGKSLFDSMNAAGGHVTIVETSGGNEVSYDDPADRFRNADGTHGAGSDSTISFNPNRGQVGDGSEPWMTRPTAVGLGHELVHSERAMHGNQPPGQTGGVNNRELQAVGLPPHDEGTVDENGLRSDLGEPERTSY